MSAGPNIIPEFALDEAMRLGAVFGATDIGLVLIDLESGGILMANPVFEHMFGFPAGAMVGTDYLGLMAEESRNDAIAQNPLSGDGLPTSFRSRRHYIRPDGTDFWAEVSASIFVDPKSGRTIGIGIVKDATEQRSHELEMQAAHDRQKEQAELYVRLAADLEAARREADESRLSAESANRAKSEFLANMSHELRTPLNAVIGFGQMMAAEMFGKLGNERYREYCDDILASGNHLLEVINELLDLAKIEAGRVRLDEEPVDLADTIATCHRLIEDRANRKQIAIGIACGGLPLVLGDRRALRQIMLNLLSNAVKFTGPGGRMDVAGAVAPEGAIVITIIDTGIGIPDDEIARMIEPFAQARNSRSTGETGTGLGLSIVKSLLDLHGGALTISSTMSVGTTVTVTLPAERVLSFPIDAEISGGVV